MSQHDYNIADATGGTFRADLNQALAAIVSQNSGATEPATMFAYQFWADTTSGKLKQRNAANNAWIEILDLASGEGVALKTHVATSKATPVDVDELPLADSAASFGLKKLTWANIKATLKTYFDTLYLAVTTAYAPNFVNSSCMVGQRSSAGITTSLSTSRQIGGCDNIIVWASGGAVSAGTITQITTAISGTTGYASRAAGVTLTGAGQISHSIRMEAKEAVKYKNKTASFSVKADHDVGSAIDYTLVVKKADAADNFTTTTVISTGSASSVASATATTLTFDGVAMGDCSNGIELEVRAACGAVTTKNFNCTEFSIDMAAAARPYRAQDHATEVARCHRYLPLWAEGANKYVAGGGQCASATSAYIPFEFPARTRIPPTGIAVSSVAHLSVNSATGAGVAATNTLFSSATQKQGWVAITTASGLAQGDSTAAYHNSASGYIMFTGAELL